MTEENIEYIINTSKTLSFNGTMITEKATVTVPDKYVLYYINYLNGLKKMDSIWKVYTGSHGCEEVCIYSSSSSDTLIEMEHKTTLDNKIVTRVLDLIKLRSGGV